MNQNRSFAPLGTIFVSAGSEGCVLPIVFVSLRQIAQICVKFSMITTGVGDRMGGCGLRMFLKMDYQIFYS